MKPYQQIPIKECGEEIVPIPLTEFAIVTPHPYIACGADYQGLSPYYLRVDILDRLRQAQEYLQKIKSGWKIQIFDAYRPVYVQQYMVDYTFNQVLVKNGLIKEQLTAEKLGEIWQQVYQIWAIPSDNIATPPPHSTGAAIDITLVDHQGKVVNMGAEIDEMSPKTQPDYFATATNPQEQKYHHHRQILYQIMKKAGFERHPGEWWHFSRGDQLWAWICHQNQAKPNQIAYYGRI